MNLKLTRLFSSVAVLAVIFSFAGCSKSDDVAIPTLPPLQKENAESSPTPQATASLPSSSPAPTASAAPSASPSPSAVPSPSASPKASADAPVLGLRDETLPTDMKQYGVADLRGFVTVDRGRITEVCGEILDSTGAVVQESTHHPDSAEFSLAGSVNAELLFANLAPGKYTYRLSATAVNGDATVEEVLIKHDFTVS